MSFIYENPWLINDLIKIGQGKTLDPTENVSPAQAQVNMGLKMLDNIQKQFSPIDPNAPAEISTQSDTEVPLRPTALESIGALASFLSQAKITVNGKLPVVDHDPQQEGYQFYRLEGNALYAEPADRSTNKLGLWINPELLSAYIISLQAQNAKKPNKVLETYLGSLIQESNKLLGTKVNPTYQPPKPPEQPGQGDHGQNTAANNPTLLKELASLQPFNSQYINFGELQRFTKGYVQLKPSMTASVQQIDTSISLAQGVMNNPSSPIQLNNITPDKFKLLCKNANQGKILANYLYTVISYAGSLYQDFITSFGQAIQADPRLGGANVYRQMTQQIAPGGPQQSNIDDLSQMMNLV